MIKNKSLQAKIEKRLRSLNTEMDGRHVVGRAIEIGILSFSYASSDSEDAMCVCENCD